MSEIIGWHFASDTLRDGSPLPAKGVTLPRIEHIEPCASGYHLSERIIDALKYAPGCMVARVQLVKGDTIAHGFSVDKHVGHARKTLSSYVNCENILRDFARWCALDVIDLWNAPPVVKAFLETGHEDLKPAARATAQATVQAAARAAAQAAARATAQAAAWYAAQDAARNAARAAAQAAAQATERVSFREQDAAWDAAWHKQNKKLTEMVERLIEGQSDDDNTE